MQRSCPYDVFHRLIARAHGQLNPLHREKRRVCNGRAAIEAGGDPQPEAMIGGLIVAPHDQAHMAGVRVELDRQATEAG